MTEEQHTKLERLVNTGATFSADKYRKEIGMGDETYQEYKSKYRTPERRDEIKREAAENERKQKKQQEEATAARIKEELPGLNQDAVRRANNVSMFDHGSVAAKEALSRVDEYRKRNQPKDNYTDEQKAYLQQREQEYKQLITEYYNDSLNRYADNPSWVVTGRGNYNVRAHEKKMNAAQNKASEYEKKLKRFEENTKKGLESRTPDDQQIARWRQGKWKHGETVSADDPLAAKKLQAKLDYLSENQAQMKAANAYYRKNGTMKGFEGFSEKTNANIDAQMKDLQNRGYTSQRQPFASYSLTNNNAQIKATQQRLKEVGQIKERANSANSGSAQSFAGGKVVRNAENNRLQIVFDGKPSDAVRAQLKANGFKWAPSQGAWQRQLTSNAERALERMMQE